MSSATTLAGRIMPNAEPRTIAFVTYPGMTLLDLVGPITTFLGLTRGLVLPLRHYRTVCVGERLAPTQTDTPMALLPEQTYTTTLPTPSR
jgi:hypothetical protein